MYDRADARLPRPKMLLLCFLAMLGVVAATLGLQSPAPAEARGKASLDRTERQVIRHINRQRARHGLRRLRPSRSLSLSADYHCWDMLRGNFFAHSSSNGASMGSRVRRFSRAHRIGENLAYVSSRDRRGVARRVVGMWMNSPSHRAALLNRKFRKIGLARRTGSLGSMRAMVFTADFASRR